MVVYVLWYGRAPDRQSGKLGGGLVTRGYNTMAIQPGVVTTQVGERLQPHGIDVDYQQVGVPTEQVYGDEVFSPGTRLRRCSGMAALYPVIPVNGREVRSLLHS